MAHTIPQTITTNMFPVVILEVMDITRRLNRQLLLALSEQTLIRTPLHQLCVLNTPLLMLAMAGIQEKVTSSKLY